MNNVKEVEIVDIRLPTIQLETNKRNTFISGGTFYSDQKPYKADVFKAFSDLLEILPKYDYNSTKSKRLVIWDGVSWDRYCLEEQTGNAMLELGEQIKKALLEAYKEGKEHGKKLLQQLNSGEITLENFDKK